MQATQVYELQKVTLSKNSSCVIMCCVNTPCVLENCERITVGPYNLGYPKLREHFQAAGVDTSMPPTKSNRQQPMDASE